MAYIFTFFVLLFAIIVWWLTDEIKDLHKKLYDARFERRELEVHLRQHDDFMDDISLKYIDLSNRIKVLEGIQSNKEGS